MTPPLISPGMLTFLKNVATEQNQYEAFKKTLPSNLRDSPEEEYDMKYWWQNTGKPKDFYDTQEWDKGKSFEENYKKDISNWQANKYERPQSGFSLEQDIAPNGNASYSYHGSSVEPNTLRFLKPPTHPTIKKELDWYSSNDPEAVDFRSKYDLDKSGKFYKYVPKKK